MGKKKLSLKPVQRGFATTSVPTKKAKEQAAAAKAEKEAAVKAEEAVDSGTASGASAPQQPGSLPPAPTQAAGDDDSWDNEQTVENIVFQGLVDRLQDKADKEVSRVLKAIEQDRRFASTFTRLDINYKIKTEVLESAVKDDSGFGIKGLDPGSTTADEDKSLLRLFVAYQVLSRLGFPREHIDRCVLEGLGEGDGWAEGVEWMWLHLTEDECLRVTKSPKREDTQTSGDNTPLLGVNESEHPVEKIDSPKNKDVSTAVSTPPASTPAGAGGSLFQSLAGSESDTDSEDDDLDKQFYKENETWAKIMLELDALRIAAGVSGKGKGKRGKGSGVVLETPAMVKLKAKLAKVEKEYMFNRKEAELLFKTLKSKRDMDMLEAKLKGQETKPESETNPPTPSETDQPPTAAESATGSDNEDGGLFGNLLDEPAEGSVEPTVSSNTMITVRPMPLPKAATSSGNTPKAFLKTGLAKSSARQAVISCVRLSTNPRAARSGIEIRWSTDKRRVWRMDDIACQSFEESENYVSTLALHDLISSGDVVGINWRALPPAYRDLWDELEVVRKDQENVEKREAWKTLKSLADQKFAKADERGGNGNLDKAQPAPAPSTGPTKGLGQADYNEGLQAAFEKRCGTPAYRKMRTERDTLPIAPFREQIMRALDSSQILVFSGETGCGKSTQLPSFILENQLSQGKPCKIIVTEPRRISAISLAQRVSQELGDAPNVLGTNNSLVGYSIRLESKMSNNTRLAFMTNGIALRMLEGGSSGSKGTALDEVTHIIVDEVHERSIESDFLLIVLKELLRAREDLKVVLMSATVDAEKISDFFGGCPFMQVPGRTFPVNVNYLEDAVELTGWHIDESSPYAVWASKRKSTAKQLEWTEEGARDEDESETEEASDPTKLSSTKYSTKTVETVNLLDSRQIPYDLIVRLLERVCFEDQALQRYSAATLVFMPGLAEIRKLNDTLQSHPLFGTSDFIIYPLHSTISSEGQSAVFKVPPRGVRKIVISTNIAETGVTIPDITCVIDSGKQREMRYDEKRQLSRLVETYIARSNAKQRVGRAGRVQEGLAFHLFTKARHDMQLAEHPIPEMLRLSLQDLALRIKILKVKMGNTVEEVLLRALDPPSATNIQRAVAALVEVKALTPSEEITPMGRLLSKLPMDVHLGKFLLLAAMFKCLDPALTIAATLNSKSPFLSPFGFEAQAAAVKKGFATGNSDFLTIANVFNSWRRASDTPSFMRTFCKKNFVSHQTLQQIEELRQQLLAYLIDTSFIDVSAAQKQEISRARFKSGAYRTRFVNVPSELDANSGTPGIIEAALAAGLYPKILSVEASGGLRTIASQQPVSIGEITTNHMTYFTLMQSKRLYAWEVGPVEDRSLVLLCGDTADIKVASHSVQIDRNRIRFQMDPKAAIAIKRLREQFALAMSMRIRGRPWTPGQEKWFDLGLRCIATGLWDDDDLTISIS